LNVIVRIAFALVWIGFALFLISQCRKPRGWLGRLIAALMNSRHAGLTKWGLAHVDLEKGLTVLDVGCGGGATVALFAASAGEGRVFGVDYALASVTAAQQRNANRISAGRVHIQQASVSHLPFADRTFDLVSAVETHYYWPDPLADMGEIFRTLKAGGRFVVIAETHRDERFGRLLAVPMAVLRARYLTVREHHDLLAGAGFVDIAIHQRDATGWICCVARKPA